MEIVGLGIRHMHAYKDDRLVVWLINIPIRGF